MCVLALWSVIFLCASGIHTGNAFSDPDKCISNEKGRSSELKIPYCMLSQPDVNLACPRNKKIVISGLQLAIKQSDNSCTKRILASTDFFCCAFEEDDALYDAHCLQNVWNTEDTRHYHQFAGKTLQKCMNKSHCLIDSEMFENLQKEIPSTRKYSSYLQIGHQCIKDPSNTVDVCSSRSVTGKEIHLQNDVSLRLGTKRNETCVCHLTSASMNNVVVRAVDVRVSSAGLILKSETREKDLSNSHEPLFGYREIFTAQKLELTLTKTATNTDDKLWLHLAGSNGQDLHVTCKGLQQNVRSKMEETTTTVRSTTKRPIYQAPVVAEVEDQDQDEKLGEYWPIIYLGAGAGITFVVVVCILGSVLICRYSMKKGKRDHGYRYPYHQSQVSYHKNGQYDTVLDDNMMTSQSEPYEWPHAFVK